MLALILFYCAGESYEFLVKFAPPEVQSGEPGRAARSHGTSMARVTSVWRWSHSARVKASLTSAKGYW